jgi:hypothetical protein
MDYNQSISKATHHTGIGPFVTLATGITMILPRYNHKDAVAWGSDSIQEFVEVSEAWMCIAVDKSPFVCTVQQHTAYLLPIHPNITPKIPTITSAHLIVSVAFHSLLVYLSYYLWSLIDSPCGHLEILHLLYHLPSPTDIEALQHQACCSYFWLLLSFVSN